MNVLDARRERGNAKERETRSTRHLHILVISVRQYLIGGRGQVTRTS
jgi:hypothetical protein